MKKRRSTRSRGKRFLSFLITIICLAGIALPLYLLWENLYSSVADANARDIGYLTEKENYVKRRPRRTRLWNYLRESSDIYAGDYILTENQCKANFLLEEGNSSLELYENTLAQVVDDEGEVSFHFLNGVMLFQTREASKYKVRAGDKEIIFGENAKAVISYQYEQNQDKNTVISVEQGDVFVRNAPKKEQGAVVARVKNLVAKADPEYEEKQEKETEPEMIKVEAGSTKVIKVTEEEKTPVQNNVITKFINAQKEPEVEQSLPVPAAEEVIALRQSEEIKKEKASKPVTETDKPVIVADKVQKTSEKEKEKEPEIEESSLKLISENRKKVVEAEKERKEAEQKAIEEKKLAEKKEIERKKAEAERKEKERKIAQEKKKAEEARIAKEKKEAQERKAAAEKKAALEKKQAQERKSEQEKKLAEERKAAEERKLAEERKIAEVRKIAEERKASEEKKFAEEQKQAMQRKEMEERRLAEEKRIAEERKIAQEKQAQEEKQLAEEKLAQEQKAAEEQRLAEEAEKAEAERMAEEEKRVQEEKLAEEQRVAEEKAAAEERKQALEEKLAKEQERREEERKKKLEESRPAVNAEIFTAKVPQNLFPLNNKKYTEEDFIDDNPSISFIWKAIPEANNYLFEIKNDKGDVLISEKVGNNKYLLSDKIDLIGEDGTYKWSVTALARDGENEYRTQTAENAFEVNLGSSDDSAELDFSNLVED